MSQAVLAVNRPLQPTAGTNFRARRQVHIPARLTRAWQAKQADVMLHSVCMALAGSYPHGCANPSQVYETPWTIMPLLLLPGPLYHATALSGCHQQI